MRFLFMVSLIFGISSFAISHEPDRVAKLVEQLGSPDFRVRESASKELLNAGPSALPTLVKASESENAELAERAKLIASAITRRADNEKTLAPTLVEITAVDQPLSEIVAALEKQTGYKLVVPDGTKRVTIRTGGKVPFWVAVRQISEAAGLEFASRSVAPAESKLSPFDSVQVLPRPVFQPIAPPAPIVPPAPVRPRIPALPAAPAQPIPAEKAIEAAQAEALQRIQAIQAMQIAMLQARQIEASQGRVSATAPAIPAGSPIKLRASAGPANPVTATAAVLVEVVPPSAAVTAAHSSTTVPIVLHCLPEPRLTFVKVESVRVNLAIDDAGRSLATSLAEPAIKQTPTTIAMPTTEVVAELAAGTGPVTKLREFAGVIRATIRTTREPLAIINGLDINPAGSIAGPDGVALKVLKITVPTDSEQPFTIDLSLSYDSTKVDITGEQNVTVNETIVVNNGGRMIMRRQVAGGMIVGGIDRGDPAAQGTNSLLGLTVTDGTGKPFTLASQKRSRFADGTGVVTETLKLTAKPTDKNQGPPTVVTFAGTRAKVVEIPFRFENLPVQVGTGPAIAK